MKIVLIITSMFLLFFSIADVTGDVRVSKHFTTKPCGTRRTSIPDHEMKIIEGN